MASLDDHQKANGARLSRLLIDKGTEAMRKVFDNIHHPSTLAAVLNSYRSFLQKLRCINCSQMDILFPPSGSNAVSEDFDITLLFVLLRNICGLHPPASTGSWDKNPPSTDASKEANLARIKYYRNVVYGHITSTGINDTDFHLYWDDLSSALLCLGVCRGEIELLRRAPLDENCYLNLIREWKSKEDKLEIILHDQSDTLAKLGNVPERLEKVEEALKELNLKEAKNVVDYKPELENLKGIQDQQDVTSQLAKCSFKGDIKRFCKSFHEGTRSWLLRKLSQWFTDVESDTTVMALIAGPGIGKSVFAAKVCKVYEEMGQLAACHFCKFNFSDCRNPQIMLESLSSHMCQSVPGFKEKLTEQLLRRHSRDSIADTFRVLLNDPLHSLEEREPMMIVIDGLDEMETSGKSELLDLIAREFSKLPMWIKSFITSRPELPVRQKLNHVSNLEIQATNDNNNEDVKHFLASRLADYEVSENIFDTLVKRCEGSFLFAYHILKAISLRYKHTGFKSSDIESCVPKSIGSVYEEYFDRLKHEVEKLRNRNSSEVNFDRILEIMAAGLGPIPLDFVARVLKLPADTRAMRRVIREVNERLSALLLVSDDCITIFHQTVVDWLLSREYDEHSYTVDFKPGHKHLWQVCRSEFENLESIRWDRRREKTRTYAAKYGLEHLKLLTNPDVRGATPGKLSVIWLYS